jgi:hypothetical protein
MHHAAMMHQIGGCIEATDSAWRMLRLLAKWKYDNILQFCLDRINSADPWSLFIAGNKQAYKWTAKYDTIVVGGESAVLVLHPTKGPLANAQFTCLSILQQPTYVERLFLDLLKIHRVDHCKGNTFSKCAKWAHENVPVRSARCSPDAALSALQ